jgi:serine/threonine-protein kinase
MGADRVLAGPDRGVTRRDGPSSLPADILQQSCRRIGMAGAAFAVVWTVTLIGTLVLVRAHPDAPGLGRWPMPAAAYSAIGIMASVALALLAPRLHTRPERLITIGLAFEVLTAGLVAFSSTWPPDVTSTRISWVAAVILGYSAVAPSAPGRTLIAGLLAASMDPLAAWVSAARGEPVEGNVLVLVNLFLPNYICAVGAVVPARIVQQLGRQVRRARELGGYRLGGALGSGGMGEVYRAEHRMLARPAAIKVIRPDMLGTGLQRHVALERFKREAKAAAILRSPHTIDLYDFGVSSDGTFYYVMELLDGVSFEDLVTRFGPLPAARAASLVAQACDSLAEAHACGIIHRDLKPSNLFASRLGYTVDFVKVLDFGLVKFSSRAEDRQPTLTMPDVATGTPAFMAPEVALGDRSADHRLDIYSLGCVLYWLLTGHLVFEEPNAVRQMQRHINDAPEPPSRRVELPIPPALDAAVLACLAKRPHERPATVVDLATRLAGVPFDEPWTPERARRWWERHLPQTPRAATPEAVGMILPRDAMES